MQDNREINRGKRNKMLHDREGNLSSKRIVGLIMVIVGACFLITIGIISVFKMVADPTTALDVGKTFIYGGAGLLASGVIEHLGPKGGM